MRSFIVKGVISSVPSSPSAGDVYILSSDFPFFPNILIEYDGTKWNPTFPVNGDYALVANNQQHQVLQFKEGFGWQSNSIVPNA